MQRHIPWTNINNPIGEEVMHTQFIPELIEVFPS